jgi:hypothetical protein
MNPEFAAFTLMPSSLSTCARDIVYEFRAALLLLYAENSSKIPLGLAWKVLDPAPELKFNVTDGASGVDEASRRGRNAVVICIKPKKFVSKTARIAVIFSALVGLCGGIPIPKMLVLYIGHSGVQKLTSTYRHC